MIDSQTFDAFSQIERRAGDVRHAYESGFEPSSEDVATERSARGAVGSANPLAAVAPDGTYFVVGSTDRPRAYTRDGELRFAGGGLEQRDGTPVLGFATGTPRAALEPLRADPIDVALGRVRNAHVDADGAVAYTRATVDPRSGAHLTTLLPLDKARNAERVRRVLAMPTAHQSQRPVGIAPHLRALMADYAATGLPPAYLPKHDSTDDSPEDS